MLASSTLKTITRFSEWVGEERRLPGPPWPLNAILLAVIAVSPLPLAALALEEVTALFWLVLVADLVLLFVVAVVTSGRRRCSLASSFSGSPCSGSSSPWSPLTLAQIWCGCFSLIRRAST